MADLDPGDAILLRIGPYVEREKSDLTHVKWEKHPESKNRVMTQINCKICHEVIGGQVESDAKVPSRVIRDATYIYKILTFSRFSAYTEIEITFDDGSKHVTHLCTSCVRKLDDPDTLEYLYSCDLAQWLWEEQHGHGPALWHTYPECATRKPVAWKDNGGLT
jgi:hypothetical protein